MENKIKNKERLELEDEKEIIKKIRKGDKKLRDEFIKKIRDLFIISPENMLSPLKFYLTLLLKEMWVY